MTAPDVSADADADADADAAQAAPRGGLRGALGRFGALGWGLLVVALIGAAAYLGVQLHQANQRQAARQDALQAARQEALNLTSVDGTNLQKDLEQVLSGATGQFRQEFAAQSSQLKKVLTENKVKAQGQVLEAALTRADRDTATALVAIDSQVSNTAIPNGQTRIYRMKLDLERVGSRWLTNNLQFVS